MADAIQASSRLAARTSRSHSYDHASNSGFDMGDDDTAIDSSTDEICVPGSEHTGRWTRKEHELFLDALKKYGKEWKKVASAVKTRTVVQTRTHAQKYFQKVHKSGFGGGYSDDDAFESVAGSHTSVRSTSSGTRRTSKRQRRPTEQRRNVAQAYHHHHSDLEDGYDDDDAMEILSSQSSFASTPILTHKKLGSFGSGHLPEDFPQPSPAACGKRKEAELTAAKMLASHSASREMEGANALSTLKGGYVRPGEIVRRQRINLPMLSIINPDVMNSGGTPADGSMPTTPWEKEIRALGNGSIKKHANPLPVDTPSQQKDFLEKIRSHIDHGDVSQLTDILEAAEAASASHIEPLPLNDIADEPAGDSPGATSQRDIPSAGNASAKPSNTPVKSEPKSPPRKSNQSLVARTLNKQSVHGTVLLYACAANLDQNKVLQICKCLIEHGASPTTVGESGETCLHVAAIRGHERVGRLLLNRGCPVNAIGPDGNAAVHIAMLAGHGHFIELLADFGANCHLRNAQSRAALDLAEPRLRTLILFHEDCLEHSARRVDDWEGPDRLLGIMHRLQNREEFPEHELEISSHFDKAPVDMLSRVHSAEYIAFVDTLSKKMQLEAAENGNSGKSQIVPFTPQVQAGIQKAAFGELKKDEYCDTSFSAGTLQAARRAAGAVAYAVDRVLLGRNRNAFCCVRPPGHHAGYNGLLTDAKSCGFCIFNSVAAGALHALEGHNCEKVAIIDLDIHHGNGTEDIVRRYTHPSRLLFFSLHLYDKGLTPGYEFFPGSGDHDDAAHNIINVPILPMWHSKHQTSTTVKSRSPAYRQAIIQRLLPSLRAFNPDLILLSTGFDPALGDVGNSKTSGDNEGGMDMTPEDFEWVTSEILKISDICCAGRVVSVLEGGYGSYSAQARQQAAATLASTRSKRAANSGTGATPSSPEKAAPALDRHLLAAGAASHVHSLVDAYLIEREKERERKRGRERKREREKERERKRGRSCSYLMKSVGQYELGKKDPTSKGNFACSTHSYHMPILPNPNL
eukprot:GSChrysophyteH1.ASY1.ANO1.1993.1 assembled CDS